VITGKAGKELAKAATHFTAPAKAIELKKISKIKQI
jgi:hypothetical protein